MKNLQRGEIVAIATIGLIDDSPSWDTGIKKLNRFRSALEEACASSDFATSVNSAEVLLNSPNGTVPIEFDVEIVVRGSSWSELRSIADRLLDAAVGRVGARIIEEPISLPSRNEQPAISEWFDQEGTQLVPA